MILGWMLVAFLWGACAGGLIVAAETRKKEKNRHSANVNGSTKKRKLYIERIAEKQGKVKGV